MELHINGISASYGRYEALRDISFSLPSGSFTAVIGRNGSGKSTLVSCLAGLHPYRGEITVGGVCLRTLRGRERARRVSLLPQQIGAPRVTVEELVRFGRSPYLPSGASLGEEDVRCVEKALASAELLPLRERYVNTLSGGERRRAYLGMTLAQNTPVVLLDEPTANLDLSAQAHLWRLIRQLPSDGGRTVVAVMHDLGDAVRFADHVVLLDGGKLCFAGTVEGFLSTTLAEEILSVRRHFAQDGVFFTGV